MLLKPNIPFIDVPVRPIEKDGVLFQRSTRYLCIAPWQDPATGAFTVLLTVLVQHFLTNSDGSAGSACPGLMPSYELTFRADNTEAVDVSTEQVVKTQKHQMHPDDWEAELEADPRPLMQRGDAYGARMHGGPVDMVPQIRAAMGAADGPPYYRFGGQPEAPTA